MVVYGGALATNGNEAGYMYRVRVSGRGVFVGVGVGVGVFISVGIATATPVAVPTAMAVPTAIPVALAKSEVQANPNPETNLNPNLLTQPLQPVAALRYAALLLLQRKLHRSASSSGDKSYIASTLALTPHAERSCMYNKLCKTETQTAKLKSNPTPTPKHRQPEFDPRIDAQQIGSTPTPNPNPYPYP